MATIPKPNATLLLTLLFIVTISPPNNAEQLVIFPHLTPPKTTTTTPPTAAPAPSPSHHHHHDKHNHTKQHAHNHTHSHPSSPAHSPVLVPTPSPASPPKQQPSKPVLPAHPPSAKAPATQPPAQQPRVNRRLVAVQGMVYCKNCSFSGVNTLTGASPLPGARVVLRCRNTLYILRKTTTTDKNGYFFLEAPPLLTTYGAHKCKVYLAHKASNSTNVPAPEPCSSITDLNNGASGAYLFSNNTGPPKPLPTFSLFSVGPFAYESTGCAKNSTRLV